MGTTSAYALRFADSTSNAELWTHFQNLATDVDTVLTTKFGVIARWRRETSKTFLASPGTELGVVRIDGVALLGGIYYTIETNSLSITSVSGETALSNARLSTGGAATIASAVIGYVEANCSTAFSPRQSPTLVAEYAPVSNVTASVLLTITRSGGTGNTVMNGSATQPIILMVKAWGKAVTPSGTDI